MAVSSINTNLAAYYAYQNISNAQDNVTSSVARLSSGNAIVRASDNVAALAVGTGLAGNISTLKVAQQNASQGTSLLQVAGGAIAQITDILQRQQQLATQATSGSLTDTQRGFLDQEFQALTLTIDNLVSSTNFNGVRLLDGTLSQQSLVNSTSTQSTKGTATLGFSTLSSGTTVKINGVTFTAGTDFTVGTTVAQTVANLAAELNDPANATSGGTGLTAAQQLAIGEAVYTAQNGTLTIASRTGGSLGNNFRLDLTGTATVTGDSSSVGGDFGGSYVSLFSSGYSDATTTITTSGTATATTPFVVGEAISAQVIGHGGSSVTLYTLQTGDSLQDIVNGINASTSTTGITATLTYNGTSGGYNIRLDTADATAGLIVGFGANSLSSLGINGVSFVEDPATPSNSAGKFVLYNSRIDAFETNLAIATATGDIVNNPGSGTTTAPFATGDTFTIAFNGGTAQTLYTIGATDSLRAIVEGINDSIASSGVYAAITGSAGSYNIRFYYTDATVAASRTVTVSAGANLDTYTAISADTATAVTTSLTPQAVYGLEGGEDDGLGLAATTAVGTVGDDIITGVSQTAAKVVVAFPDIDASNLDDSSNFGTGNNHIDIAGVAFYFTSTTDSSKAANEITIGDTLKETLDNAVSTINSYFANGYGTGEQQYLFNQIELTRDGNQLVFQGKGISNVFNIAGSSGAATVSVSSISSATVTNSGILNNASNQGAAGSGTFGVDATGISNADFLGTISGFTATYKSANTVDLSITIGDYTYLASGVSTNPTSNTTVRLYSNTLSNGSNGGYFDIQLQANKGQAVSNQSGANSLAQRLNTAFSSVTFFQQRSISSYQGEQAIVANNAVIGTLVGTSVSAQLGSFTDQKLSDIQITAPSGGNADAKITFVIGGEEFVTKAGLGGQLGANQTYRLVSTTNANHYVDFTTGDSTIDLSTDANVQAVRSALLQAFGAGNGSSALSFQIGVRSTDTLSVSIANVTSNEIFAGKSLNLLTLANAQEAGAAISSAIDTVISVQATIGSLQSSFGYASANISTSIQNQDSARSQFLDTDIASESTKFATAQVKLQAGISTLAQANQQLQNLLKLIG